MLWLIVTTSDPTRFENEDTPRCKWTCRRYKQDFLSDKPQSKLIYAKVLNSLDVKITCNERINYHQLYTFNYRFLCHAA